MPIIDTAPQRHILPGTMLRKDPTHYWAMYMGSTTLRNGHQVAVLCWTLPNGHYSYTLRTPDTLPAYDYEMVSSRSAYLMYLRFLYDMAFETDLEVQALCIPPAR